MDEVRGHCPTQWTPISHIGISLHVFDDFRTSFADTHVSARKTNRILAVNVTHYAVLVVSGQTSTFCRFLLTVTIVYLINLILGGIVLICLIVPFFLVTFSGVAAAFLYVLQAVKLFDDLEGRDLSVC